MASQSQPVLPETGIGEVVRPGYWVEYMGRRSNVTFTPDTPLIEGEVYQVKSVAWGLGRDGEAHLGYVLEGQDTYSVETGKVGRWDVKNFRPGRAPSRSQGASDGPQGQDGQHKTNTLSSPSPTTGADQ
jgi:hypothetical protein